MPFDPTDVADPTNQPITDYAPAGPRTLGLRKRAKRRKPQLSPIDAAATNRMEETPASDRARERAAPNAAFNRSITPPATIRSKQNKGTPSSVTR